LFHKNLTQFPLSCAQNVFYDIFSGVELTSESDTCDNKVRDGETEGTGGDNFTPDLESPPVDGETIPSHPDIPTLSLS